MRSVCFPLRDIASVVHSLRLQYQSKEFRDDCCANQLKFFLNNLMYALLGKNIFHISRFSHFLNIDRFRFEIFTSLHICAYFGCTFSYKSSYKELSDKVAIMLKWFLSIYRAIIDYVRDETLSISHNISVLATGQRSFDFYMGLFLNKVRR